MTETKTTEGRGPDRGAAEAEARQRLAQLFGERDEATLAALADCERLMARPGHRLGFAGALAAHAIRQQLPAETALLDAARAAAEKDADAADTLRRPRLALERLADALAGEVAEAGREVARRRERLAEIEAVIAALARRSAP